MERVLEELKKIEEEAEQIVNDLTRNFEMSIKRRHEEIIKNCESEIDRIRRSAEKKNESAVNMVFKAVIGEKQD